MAEIPRNIDYVEFVRILDSYDPPTTPDRVAVPPPGCLAEDIASRRIEACDARIRDLVLADGEATRELIFELARAPEALGFDRDPIRDRARLVLFLHVACGQVGNSDMARVRSVFPE